MFGQTMKFSNISVIPENISYCITSVQIKAQITQIWIQSQSFEGKLSKPRIFFTTFALHKNSQDGGDGYEKDNVHLCRLKKHKTSNLMLKV